MSFTNMNDLHVLQNSDAAVIGAVGGDDTYILSPHILMGQDRTLTISDSQGVNSIQLVENLRIESFAVGSNALQLTLPDDVTVTILDAGTFGFDVGGNILAGIDNPDLSFSEFVENILHVTVPVSGIVSGESIVIGNEQPSVTVELPVGTDDGSWQWADYDTAEIFTLALDGENGAYQTDANTQIVLYDFVANDWGEDWGWDWGYSPDTLKLDLPDTVENTYTDLSQLNGLVVDFKHTIAVQVDPFDSSTVINFGTDANGDLISLTLTGVIDPESVTIAIV